jgi:hypothetical protein
MRRSMRKIVKRWTRIVHRIDVVEGMAGRGGPSGLPPLGTRRAGLPVNRRRGSFIAAKVSLKRSPQATLQLAKSQYVTKIIRIRRNNPMAPDVHGEGAETMASTITMFVLLSVIAVGAALCVFGPLTALGVMFWHWHKELRTSARMRLARTTQVR